MSTKPKLSKSKRTKPVSRVAKPKRKSAPVSKALRPSVSQPPKMVTTSDTVRVHHREFVADVTGQTAFTSLSFPINPGYDILFTWLPEIANRYERYQFGSLKFIYEPRCSTATAGSVILAIDYDPLDAAPANKAAVYSYHHSAQSSAWDEACLQVDRGILANRGTLFNRAGAIPANSDLKSYDLGNLWLCVSGFSGAVQAGELFVEYDVLLKIPQVSDTVQALYFYTTAGCSKATPFGSARVTEGILDVTITSTVMTFLHNWSGKIDFDAVGTGLAGSISTAGSTCIIGQEADVSNAGGTEELSQYSIIALRGQQLTLSYAAATTVTVVYVTCSPS